MKKRQLKKNFKKKYAVNPKQAARIISKIDLSKFYESIAVAATTAFEKIAKWLKEFNDRVSEIGFEATKSEIETKMAKLSEEKEGSKNGN